MVKFNSTKAEQLLIDAIARRANAMAGTLEINIDYPVQDAAMEVTATHCNGEPLDLKKLLAADDFNFSHDVFGIRRHLNRDTGKLQNCFLPRCHAHKAKRQRAA